MSWCPGKGWDSRTGVCVGRACGPDTRWHYHCFLAGPPERRCSVKRVISSQQAQKAEQRVAEAKMQQHTWPKLILTLHGAGCNYNVYSGSLPFSNFRHSDLGHCDARILFSLQRWLLAFGEGDSRTTVDLSLCRRLQGIFSGNQTQNLYVPLTFYWTIICWICLNECTYKVLMLLENA